MLAQAVADSPEIREEAAETAVDWETSMTDFQKRVVIRLLSVVATAEEPGRVREAQLNAISNLFLPPFMTKADVAPLFEIPADTLDQGDVEYLNGFLEALAPFAPEPSGRG
ncbi:hypothetical protein [Microlunatus antarcticus]|uniref:Uncharacterized protein n=1 Tax=Microlunatus antarcticus TaxID=53388 RepID=A0A7W5JU09_9ACTN|nr:hypothetical protein [Microlunatus antarcticus]MBB3325742.1 hypothetical protein [Microlunatus antarcticus]